MLVYSIRQELIDDQLFYTVADEERLLQIRAGVINDVEEGDEDRGCAIVSGICEGF